MIFFVTFDLIESETVFGPIIEFPEEGENSISGKWDESGYESHFLMNILGIGFIFIVVILFIMLILSVTIPLKPYSSSVYNMHNKVSGAIYWGVWIRFFMEESLVIYFALFCNVMGSNNCIGQECEELAIEPSTNSTIASNSTIATNSTSVNATSSASNATLTEDLTVTEGQYEISMTFLAINNATVSFLAFALLSMPFYIAIFYNLNYHKMKEPEFEKKHGEVYASMHDDRRSSLFYSAYFLVRRYIFVATIGLTMFMHQPWMQIGTQLVLALLSAAYLHHFKPFTDVLVG